MPVRPPQLSANRLRRLWRRLGSERGYIMLVALGVLSVTAVLSAAIFSAVQSDASLTRGDLDGKRAYAAAQAGVQAYLYALNTNASNSQWWETCSNDSLAATAVPGTTTGATYAYAPVSTCVQTDPVGSLIDTATGTLRMKFTGSAGTGCATGPAACQSRTIVASFRTLSPLSFLWYTVHETVDTSISSPTDHCDRFHYQTNPAPGSNCNIYWVTGDSMNGPMYSQDQLLINPGDAPVFGRTKNDVIASQVPTTTTPDDVCVASNCQNAKMLGTEQPDVTPQVPLPADNSNLLTDATKHGLVLTGTTTLIVNGNVATGANCTSASASSCTPVSISLTGATATPIVYAANAAGCNSTYNPTSVNYPQITTIGSQYLGDYYGPCGDIYIQGNYSAPLTVAAGNDVVVTDSLTNSTDPTGLTNPTGSATLGLVANQYVRIQHPCTAGNPAVTVDGAILTLSHSFFVDNYNCGGTPLGTLTIHGAIAQEFRGIVGQVGSNGYLKNYNYDDRLSLILPPYLFDLQNTQWSVFRETLCSTASLSSASSCGP
jgi:Tfp pilus assembly protein PilX